MIEWRPSRVGLKQVLVITICAMTLLASGCRSVEGETAGGASVDIDVPQYPGAALSEVVNVDQDDLSFAGSNAVAAVYRTSDLPMSIVSYYTAELDKNSNWSLGGGGGSEYVSTVILVNDMRVARVTVIPGASLRQAREEVSEIDVAPFSLDDLDLRDDETLIYVKVATCLEATVEECVSAMQHEAE